MKSKINYYIFIPKDRFFMTKAEWKRFHKKLDRAVAALSISIKGIGSAFGRVAKILRDDKFYKAICEANEYIEEKRKIK